jgi:hypothetical protein
VGAVQNSKLIVDFHERGFSSSIAVPFPAYRLPSLDQWIAIFFAAEFAVAVTMEAQHSWSILRSVRG